MVDRRFTRRGFLGGAVGASVTLVFTGCQSASPTAPSAPAPAAPAAPAAPSPAAVAPATAPTAAAAASPAAAAPARPAGAPVRRGGELTQAQAWTYPTFDLHTSSIPLNAGYHMLYEYLLRYELVDEAQGAFKLSPALAEAWEQPDAKTVVFHLRQGVKFHDGSAFDASVAKWNLERLRDHPKSFGKSYLADVDTIDAPDARTLKATLKEGSVSLPFRVSGANFGVMGMMSRAAFEKLGEDAFGQQPSGTGPMRFKQWVTDDRLTLERNPDHWRNGSDGKPLPYIDSFVSRYMPDLTVAMADLQSGQLLAVESMPANQLAVVKANPRLKLIEWPWAGPTYFQMGFNTQKPPFDNLKVRQAALYGIDHEGMAQALGFGYARPAFYSYWSPSLPGFDPSAPKYEYNPDKVKQLLTEAGFPNGIETDLLVIQREPEATIGQFAAEMWSKVGIKTNLMALERLSWINSVREGNFQACFWRNSPAEADPSVFSAKIKSDGPLNWSNFKDPELDKLMTEAERTLDEKARAELYRQAFVRLHEQAYLGTGYTLPYNYVLNEKVQGLTIEYGVPDFGGVWLNA